MWHEAVSGTDVLRFDRQAIAPGKASMPARIWGIAVVDVRTGPELKLQRARKHFLELERETQALPPDIYRITNRPTRSHAVLREPDAFLLRYEPLVPIREHFGAITGDLVNNLREALDYFVNAATEYVGPKKKLNFPFSGSMADLRQNKNFKQLANTFPELASFIEIELAPTRQTNLKLWAVTSLCNHNKHNDFLPVTSIVEIVAPEVTIGGNNYSRIRCGGDATKPLNIILSASPINVKGEFTAKANLAFPEGAIFERLSVISTMMELISTTEQVIKRLVCFLESAGYK